MNFFSRVSLFALGPLVSTACKAIGFETVGHGVTAVARFLSDRVSDRSLRVVNALTESSNQAWRTLELSLSGESLLNIADRADDKAFREQIRLFVHSAQFDGRIPAHSSGQNFTDSTSASMGNLEPVG
jgi:hypothetical protein